MKKPIPYDFVLEALHPLIVRVKAMFGAHAIYLDEKIIFILRQKEDYLKDNGVWIATTPEHHQSLQKEFTSMRSIGLFGPGPTTWQNLPEEASDFEESVLRACELVHKKDPRIGKVPKMKRKKLRQNAKNQKNSKRR